MVARAGISTIAEIKESINRLDQTGVTVKGIVFNDYKQRVGDFRGKYGKYRYAEYSY